MKDEFWCEVEELFHRALERPARDRAAFLAKACHDRPKVKQEVESLLASHEAADDFIEAPAFEVAPDLVGDALGISLTGRTIGIYAVEEEIGRGGMGVVYLARDTRLGRPVALKALAPQYTRDSHRRRRLQREAQAAASLSHPGIATVYALVEEGDELYIVTEYIRGETLRAEIERGPLAIPVLLDTALQVARALAAAHAQGIIHRDLKPENVIRTPDQTVKIVDFGLARFQANIGLTGRTTTRLTQQGIILGTPSYMSPEQLRGRTADARSDVFSLGVMLYELASGRHPFEGSDPASTIARILESEPPDIMVTVSPASLAHIVARCLAKDPDRRYQSAQAIVADLEVAKSTLSDDAIPGAAARRTDTRPGGTLTPLWWWQFHQVIVAVLAIAMLYPLWQVRKWIPRPGGLAIFFLTLMVVVTIATLRLHVWFTSRFYPEELAAQRVRTAAWIRAGDIILSLILLGGGFLIASDHPEMAALLIAVGIGTAIGSLIIEPATTRAAMKGGGE